MPKWNWHRCGKQQIATWDWEIGKQTKSRGVTSNNFEEPKTLKTFIGNATRIWNKAPRSIKDSKTLVAAIQAIKTQCQILPI